MAFDFWPPGNDLIAKVRRRLKKLKFPGIDLQNSCSGIRRRDGQKIGEPESAKDHKGKYNDPESAADKIQGEPQVDAGGTELGCRGLVTGGGGDWINALVGYVSAK